MKQNVVITGATSGIGREFAEIFAEKGCSLLLISRSEEKLASICESFKKRYPQADFEYKACDLSDINSVKSFCAELEGRRVDVLVNNAGFGMTGEFAENDAEELNRMMILNMNCLVLLTRSVIGQMKERNSGKILNVASIAAFMPNPFGNVYAATKAFVKSFSLALGEELRETGITVTALCPGPTETGFGSRSGMGDSLVFKSGVMKPAEVARAGYNALIKKRRSVIPGTRNKLTALAGALLPACIVLPVAAAMLKKQ